MFSQMVELCPVTPSPAAPNPLNVRPFFACNSTVIHQGIYSDLRSARTLPARDIHSARTHGTSSGTRRIGTMIGTLTAPS